MLDRIPIGVYAFLHDPDGSRVDAACHLAR